MTTEPSFPQNHNQLKEILSSSNSFIEPKIIKDKLIFNKNRIYTLEFDKNIKMI